MTRTDHRGPDPADARDLGEDALPRLRAAVTDLSWLRERGYAEAAALALVGDRHQLTRRQRIAVARSACSESARRSRAARRIDVAELAGRTLDIDGFNQLITLERALSGGPVLLGRDGALRDLAGVHGTWRAVAETDAVIAALGALLARAGVAAVRWWLDGPVSNSGRLAARLRETAGSAGWPWEVEVVGQPDAVLAASSAVVVTSDAGILDRCGEWTILSGEVLQHTHPSAWIVDLGTELP